MIEFKDPVAEHIKAFILDETAMEIDNRDYPSDPVWREYRKTGSRIWLYGNDKLAEKVWTGDMEAIYLDIPLVNEALRRGSFTGLIAEANSVLKGLPRNERIKEIAFIVSARNAVASSKRFAARVAVEIPLFSDSAAEICQYAQRLYQVCPEHLLPAVPYSPTGLQAAAELQQAGIPVIIRTACSLRQVKASINSLNSGFIAIDQEQEAGNPSLTSVQELSNILNNAENLEDISLMAFGLNSTQKIHQFMGFPIIVATPSAAAEYRKNHGKVRPGTDFGPPPPAAVQNTMDIVQRSRDAYRTMVLLIKKVIAPN